MNAWIECSLPDAHCPLPIAHCPLLIAYDCQMRLDKETVATTDRGALSVWGTRTVQRGRWGLFVFCVCYSMRRGFCIFYLSFLFNEVRIILYFVFLVLIGGSWGFFRILYFLFKEVRIFYILYLYFFFKDVRICLYFENVFVIQGLLGNQFLNFAQ